MNKSYDEEQVVKDVKKGLAGFARFMIGMVVFVPIQALVISYFWAWFVVPLNPVLPVLSVVQCMGVVFTARIVMPVPKYNGPDTRTEYDKWVQFAAIIPAWLTVWGIGWLFLRLVYL